MANEEFSVQVVGFMEKGAGQKLFSGVLEPLAFDVLCADGRLKGALHVSAEVRKAQAALIVDLRTFLMNDLRVDQHDLAVRIFLERNIYNSDAARDADLRRGESNAVSGIHRFEHVFSELLQLCIEDGDFGCGLFADRVRPFNDGINQSLERLGRDSSVGVSFIRYQRRTIRVSSRKSGGARRIQ